MSAPRPDDGGLLRRTRVWTAVLGLGAALATVFIAGPEAAGSVLAGTLLALLNAWVLGRIIGLMVSSVSPEAQPDIFPDVPTTGQQRPPPAGGGGWSLLALGKMLVLFAGLAVAFKAGALRPIPVVAGYLCLVVGAVVAALTSEKAQPRDL